MTSFQRWAIETARELLFDAKKLDQKACEDIGQQEKLQLQWDSENKRDKAYTALCRVLDDKGHLE